MADLYPTPTRLDLLRHVDAGRVVFAGEPGSGIRRKPTAMLREDPATYATKVAARVAELEAAGWVERPDRTAAWRLTAAGRRVLRAHTPVPAAADGAGRC